MRTRTIAIGLAAAVLTGNAGGPARAQYNVTKIAATSNGVFTFVDPPSITPSGLVFRGRIDIAGNQVGAVAIGSAGAATVVYHAAADGAFASGHGLNLSDQRNGIRHAIGSFTCKRTQTMSQDDILALTAL